jgi:hypothetical protein
MSDQQHNIQVSVKHGPNGSTMTNIRANSSTELVTLLAELSDFWSDIESHLSIIQAQSVVAAAIPGTTNAGTTTSTDGDPSIPFCAHGQRRKKITGVSKKTQKPYTMFVCDVEGDPNRPKCDAVFE